MAWPFAAQAVVVVLSVVLVSRVALPPARPRPSRAAARLARRRRGHPLGRHHAAVRTLVLTIFIFNITFGAAWSVLVLYAIQRLGMGAVGFGLLTTVGAAGGLAAILAYGWITARVSLGNLMRIGLVIETLTHLALALTTSAWVAMAIFFVFGAHAFVWGTTSIDGAPAGGPDAAAGPGRQRQPDRRLRRPGDRRRPSAACWPSQWGVTAPFWFAFVGSAVFVVLIWGQLRYVAHADEAPFVDDEAPGVPTPPSG